MHHCKTFKHGQQALTRSSVSHCKIPHQYCFSATVQDKLPVAWPAPPSRSARPEVAQVLVAPSGSHHHYYCRHTGLLLTITGPVWRMSCRCGCRRTQSPLTLHRHRRWRYSWVFSQFTNSLPLPHKHLLAACINIVIFSTLWRWQG